MKPLIGMPIGSRTGNLKQLQLCSSQNFNDQQIFAGIAYKCKKHKLTAPEWIQKKQDFEDIWNIGTLFKVQYVSNL